MADNPKPIRIVSTHPTPIVFPIVETRFDQFRQRISETVGHFTIDPGERSYDTVPPSVLDAIRKFHMPTNQMRILEG